MKVLIDNSYLHSIGRCLKGNAKGVNDLKNFIRFIGEIISNERIAINVKKNGPVYPTTEKYINQLNKISSNEKLFELINQENINYKFICNSIIERIESEIPTYTKLLNNDPDKQPTFENNSNPDSRIHDLIISSRKLDYAQSRKKNMKISAPDAAYYIISHPSILSTLKNTIKDFNLNWDIDKTISLSSAIRAEIYYQISSMYRLNYVPSLSRLNSHPLSMDIPSIKLIINPAITHFDLESNLLPNSKFITSIIKITNGNPEEIIDYSFHLRQKLKSLRNYLRKKPLFKRGDALVKYQFDKIETCQNVIDKTLTQNEPSIFETFNTELYLGIDAMKQEFKIKFFDLPHLFYWIKFKSVNKKLLPLIIPIMKSRFFVNTGTDSLKLFYSKCGLNKIEN